MKCGPDDCPIVTFSDLTPAEQRVERKRKAQVMSEQGFTEKQIAKQFGVSQATISGDLSDLSVSDKSKPAKTVLNPKGSGRHKGKRSRNPKQAQRSVDAEHADWVAFKAKAEAEGKSAAAKLGELVKEPEITRDMLSMSAQRKFDTAVRQEQRRLEAEIRGQLHAEYQKWLADLLVDYRKKEKHYNIIIARRKGFMTKADYTNIMFCLHPDQYQHRTEQQRNAAQQLWVELGPVMLKEADAPSKLSDLPVTWAEWEARKQATTALRRAKRERAKEASK